MEVVDCYLWTVRCFNVKARLPCLSKHTLGPLATVHCSRKMFRRYLMYGKKRIFLLVLLLKTEFKNS